MPDETAYYGARFYFIWEGAVRPYSFSQPSAVRKRSKAARPSGVSLNTPACSRHVSNFAPISRFTASCACSGRAPCRIFHQKVQPICVLRCGGSARFCVRLAAQHRRDGFALLRKAAGQDGKAHHLDEADVFFFDVVDLPVRMENTLGILLCGAVVAGYKVQHIAFFSS